MTIRGSVNIPTTYVWVKEMAKVMRILLECTHTYETDLNTGIQRVVRNIVKELKQVGNEVGVDCQAIIIKYGHFLAIDRLRDKPSLRSRIRAFLKNTYRFLRPHLHKLLPFPRLEKSLFFQPGYLTAIVYTFLDIFTCLVLLYMYFQRKVVPRKGDLLLLLDSSWVYRVWPAVKQARKSGVRVGLVVHDIFQVTHPHLFVPAMVERFRLWLDQAIDNVDFIIAVSQTTLDEVKGYVESRNRLTEGVKLFESFRLGSVIDNVANTGEVRNELKEIFRISDKQNTYLTVGTMEPRKNHKYLLDAFEKVWQKCPDARLCIVGSISWFCVGLKERIKFHPEYKKCLFMFNDLSDAELDYCYCHAKALVFPSLVEGFGLPLVEAIYKGLPVLAKRYPDFSGGRQGLLHLFRSRTICFSCKNYH